LFDKSAIQTEMRERFALAAILLLDTAPNDFRSLT